MNGLIIPTSFAEVVEADQYNLQVVMKSFTKEIELLNETALFYSIASEKIGSRSTGTSRLSADLCFFNNCYTSFYSGFSTLFRGHLKDSLFHIRLVAESTQNSIFLLHCPDVSELWFSEESKDISKYKDLFGKWFWKKDNRGKDFISLHYPFLISSYEFSSDLIHPNRISQELQTVVRSIEDKINIRVNFHDIGNTAEGMNYLRLGIRYMFNIHLSSLQWWYSSFQDLPLESSIKGLWNKHELKLKSFIATKN